MTPFCCWINWQRCPSWIPHRIRMWFGCRRDAEWSLIDGNGYEDQTEACSKHVGRLLRDGRHTDVTSL